MTTRHAFSSTSLTLLRRQVPPPSACYGSRSFNASRCRLRNEYYGNEADHDHREPNKNLPDRFRLLMRSTPGALTFITSDSHSQAKKYHPDNKSSASAASSESPAPAAPLANDERNGNGNTTTTVLKSFGCALVSSFNTVTLSPIPYVSFNIRLPSTTFSMIRASGDIFTASGLKDVRVIRALVGKHPIPADDDPRGHRLWTNSVESDGRLKKGKGGTWWMRCQMVRNRCVKVGDHLIVVGRVLACGAYKGGEGLGLVYAEGKYREVGEALDLSQQGGEGKEEEPKEAKEERKEEGIG